MVLLTERRVICFTGWGLSVPETMAAAEGLAPVATGGAEGEASTLRLGSTGTARGIFEGSNGGRVSAGEGETAAAAEGEGAAATAGAAIGEPAARAGGRLRRTGLSATRGAAGVPGLAASRDEMAGEGEERSFLSAAS